jgi:heptosyltransferase I
MRALMLGEDGILLIRLGAMGDIIHALPAASSLKASFPNRKLSWLVSPKWTALLEGNPAIDELIAFERNGWSKLKQTWTQLRQRRFASAFDLQGLLQSALAGRAARAQSLYGFSGAVARESHASWFYDHPVDVKGPHRVERNLQLLEAAGAHKLTPRAWIPPGKDEGVLPLGPFILTSPFAGWQGKEWPLASFDQLGQILAKEGLQLVANVPLSRAGELSGLTNIHVHTSTIPGLIAATRRATAVLGLDSGPLHLAAALDKPGVALFGPTDPALTGPYGGTMTVLRAPGVASTYKRHSEIHPSMKEIKVQDVASAILHSIEKASGISAHPELGPKAISRS